MMLNVAGSTDMRYATDISRTFGVLAVGAMFLGGGFSFAQNSAGDHAGTEKANATPPSRPATITADDIVRKKTPVAPPPLPVSLADQPSYVEDMRHLLEVGLDLRNGDLETAKRYFDANICRGEDPRLCYAWALVCLKRLRYDQALEALHSAMDERRFFFPPAWQTFIRSQVARHQFPAALQAQVELARRIEKSSTGWPDEDLKNQCAGWNGRMMAYLQTVGVMPPSLREAATKADADILAILHGPRREAYENGKGTLSEKPSKASPPDEHDIPAAQRQAEQLAGQRDYLQDKKEKLTVDAGKAKEGFEQKMSDLQQQLSQLDTVYTNLCTQGQVLASTISQAEQQRQQWRAEQSVYNARKDSDAQQRSAILAQQIFQITATLSVLRGQYTILAQQAAQVKRQAAVLLMTRNQFAATYQQGKQDMVQAGKSLEEGEKRILAEARTKDKQASVASSPRTRTPSFKSLNACFPWDFEVEKRRILDALPAAANHGVRDSEDR
jgi:hypothetical protein